MLQKALENEITEYLAEHIKRANENGERFSSVDNLIPVLYLKGLSVNSFQDALSSIPGDGAKGLSAANIVRLKKCWEDEYLSWDKRDLSGKEYACIWADGIHFHVRLEGERNCVLVIMGADSNGNKELLACYSDGYRESTVSLREMLPGLKKQGVEVSPKLAIGDGALGFILEPRIPLNQPLQLYGSEQKEQKVPDQGLQH